MAIPNGLTNVISGSDIAMPVALATNGNLILQIATKWGSAGTGTNTITLSQLIVEALN